MGREIPWFSATDVNKIEDYERFSNTKAYLKKKSGRLIFFKDQTDEIREMAENCGYKKFNKFVEHRKEWHELKRKIPLSYLEEIGARLDVIEFTVELDQEEFEQALNLTFSPDYFTVRMMPSVYINRKLPPGLTEKKAVEYVEEYSKKEKRICWIKISNIKTTWIYPEENKDKLVTYYKPGFTVENNFFIPALSGRKIGKTRLR